MFQPVAGKSKNAPEKKKAKVAEDFSSDDNEPLDKKTKKNQVRTRSQASDVDMPSPSEPRPTRRTKTAAASYLEIMSRQMLSPTLSEESFQEPVVRKIELPKRIMKGAVKKSPQNDHNMPSRPSTRSNPMVEKQPVARPAAKKKSVKTEDGRKLRGKVLAEKLVAKKEKVKVDKKACKAEAVDEPPKRPVRKCSTIDKMWIDVDGFTSDEEDFVDVGSITVEKSSVKAKNVKKDKEESKSAKVVPETKEKETDPKLSSESLPAIVADASATVVENIPKIVVVSDARPKVEVHSSVAVKTPDLTVSSSVPASHSLIARLATGASMTAKPSTLKWEVKSAMKPAPPVEIKLEPVEVKAVDPINSSIQTSSQSEIKIKTEKKASVVDAIQQKLIKAKEEAKMNDAKMKAGARGNRVKKTREPVELSEESTDSSAPSVRKRGRRPSPRAEVVTRRERPKRQCSTVGPSWIDPDSDDSSFQEDLFQLIRLSEMAEKKREIAKKRNSKEFSDSDDEPLMKKPILSAASPGSFITTDTNDGPKNVQSKSEVSLESDNRVSQNLKEKKKPIRRNLMNKS